MPKTKPAYTTSPMASLKKPFLALGRYWRHTWWHKLIVIIVSVVIVLVAGMYGISRWYMASEASKPLQLGTSFIPDYASSLGVDPQKTMDALINQVGVKRFRLVSYWSDMEPTPRNYDFSQLDWEFAKADAAHATVTLSIGLRQPRWPECHSPSFIDTSQPESQWYPQLSQFMQAVINRYKTNPALVSYELENEYFLKGFGECQNFDRSRLENEFALVKKADPKHPVIVSRSNNGIGTPLYAPTPDEFGISIYKRVWDAGVTHRYLEYPYPAWYYGFLAGVQKITTGKDMIVHEMQAEAWPPNGQGITETSLAEQNKSLDAKRLQGRFTFAKDTGMRTIDLWGSEYWYYRLEVLHDPSLWNVAKQEYSLQ
jgi:hypothetical protein